MQRRLAYSAGVITAVAAAGLVWTLVISSNKNDGSDLPNQAPVFNSARIEDLEKKVDKLAKELSNLKNTAGPYNNSGIGSSKQQETGIYSPVSTLPVDEKFQQLWAELGKLKREYSTSSISEPVTEQILLDASSGLGKIVESSPNLREFYKIDDNREKNRKKWAEEVNKLMPIVRPQDPAKFMLNVAKAIRYHAGIKKKIPQDPDNDYNKDGKVDESEVRIAELNNELGYLNDVLFKAPNPGIDLYPPKKN